MNIWAAAQRIGGPLSYAEDRAKDKDWGNGENVESSTVARILEDRGLGRWRWRWRKGKQRPKCVEYGHGVVVRRVKNTAMGVREA